MCAIMLDNHIIVTQIIGSLQYIMYVWLLNKTVSRPPDAVRTFDGSFARVKHQFRHPCSFTVQGCHGSLHGHAAGFITPPETKI